MSVISKLDRRIVIGPVRICYPNIFVPRSMVAGDELKYSACFLIPKEDTNLVEKIRQAIGRAQIAGADLWGGGIPEDLKLPLRDGDGERGHKEEFIGHFFLNAVSRDQPGVVDRRRKEIIDPREVYPGCYCNVSLTFYPFNEGTFNGVGCGLINIQKVADGEILTLRTTPEEDFQILYDHEDSLS